jgi:hypothetical protein
MYFVWVVCGLCFYGLAQFMGQIGGNIFINVAISGQSFFLALPGLLGSNWGGHPGTSTKQKYNP